MVRRKRSGWAVLETLIDRKDDKLPGASQSPVVHEAGEIGFYPDVLARIKRDNLLDPICNHGAAH
jgi:hypothetical protein